jgi:aminoglycoside phosphotransferase (APT) family kinase protein
MAKRAFGNDVNSETVTELTNGYFNTAYMVTLTNGLKTVLKVSPQKDIRVMRYEKNIMEAEVYALNTIRLLGDIPVPKVLYYDKSKEIIESEFLFLEFMDGVPLNTVRSELTEEQYRDISLELVTFVKKIHSMEGSCFGYITRENRNFSNWEDAFLFMINELLEDAKDAGVTLPYEYQKIYSIIFEKRNALSMVITPTLIHKDLWEGNILIDLKTAKITGLIDCERAIYGDSLLEAVCGFLLHNKYFMKSYTGREYLEKEEEIRILIYQIYVCLISVIECTYRKFTDDDYLKSVNKQLYEALEELINLKT